MHAPNQDGFPEPQFFPDDTPFGKGRELIVNIDVNKFGIHDIYIDDLIGLRIDLSDSNHRKRSECAPLLAMDICAHLPDPNEPIPRYEMAARKKLDAEGQLSKTKMILGWLWNFRSLTISLHKNKLITWMDGINKLITKKRIGEKELETTIGRLTHVSMIIPPLHHFLSRLCKLLQQIKNNNCRMFTIPKICVDDLHLMKDFLRWGNEGISMNQIAYRKPTHVYHGDLCPAGLGGYSHEGFAWRYYLPPHSLGLASNNLLEHMASVISPWINIIAGCLKEGDCSLSMTDSTTSEGWTQKTNFKEDEHGIQATIRIEVACSHASCFMTHRICEYSQLFPGIKNQVVDALLRDMDRTDEELTQILFTHVPSQVPNSFKIVPLPNKIESWMTSLLQQLPENLRFKEVQTMTTLGCGKDGCPTATPQDSQVMSSSLISPNSKEPTFVAVLPWLSVMEDFCNQVMLPSLVAQSSVPSITWQQLLGVTATPTHQETEMET